MSKRKRIRHNLYIPDNLMKQIKKVAKDETRSFNGQCLVFLMQGIEQANPGWDTKKETNDKSDTR